MLENRINRINRINKEVDLMKKYEVTEVRGWINDKRVIMYLGKDKSIEEIKEEYIRLEDCLPEELGKIYNLKETEEVQILGVNYMRFKGDNKHIYGFESIELFGKALSIRNLLNNDDVDELNKLLKDDGIWEFMLKYCLGAYGEVLDYIHSRYGINTYDRLSKDMGEVDQDDLKVNSIEDDELLHKIFD